MAKNDTCSFTYTIDVGSHQSKLVRCPRCGQLYGPKGTDHDISECFMELNRRATELQETLERRLMIVEIVVIFIVIFIVFF